jgi:hypothetical protein
MENSRGKCMTNKEFKRIDKVVWEISKHFLNTLETENNNPNFEFFYTPPKSPSQPISSNFDSHMNENHGRKRSKILLDAHKAIVTQVVTAKFAYKCPSKITRKSLEKHYALKWLLPVLVVVKDKGKYQKSSIFSTDLVLTS